MRRRQFLTVSAAALGLGSLATRVFKAEAAGVTDADILKEGQPASVANYCDPAKKSKACPPEIKGKCAECMFYNKDNSQTTHKGKKVAKCQLLATKPQYVWADFTCATFVKKT